MRERKLSYSLLLARIETFRKWSGREDGCVCVFYHQRSIIFLRSFEWRRRRKARCTCRRGRQMGRKVCFHQLIFITMETSFTLHYWFSLSCEKWEVKENAMADHFRWLLFWHWTSSLVDHKHRIYDLQQRTASEHERWKMQLVSYSMQICERLVWRLFYSKNEERCKFATELHYHTCSAVMMSSREDQTSREKNQVMFRYLMTSRFQVELW